MTLDEAKDLIIKYYDMYFNKTVYFPLTGETYIIKAIDVTKDDNGEHQATCYVEDANEEDSNFENGIFEHRSLKEIIKEAKLL